MACSSSNFASNNIGDIGKFAERKKKREKDIDARVQRYKNTLAAAPPNALREAEARVSHHLFF